MRVPKAQNLVRLPMRERCDNLSVERTLVNQPASVVSLQEWKTKLLKSGDPQELKTPRRGIDERKRARLVELQKLSIRQKLLRIMEMLGDEGITENQLLRTLMILEDVEPMEIGETN